MRRKQERYVVLAAALAGAWCGVPLPAAAQSDPTGSHKTIGISNIQFIQLDAPADLPFIVVDTLTQAPQSPSPDPTLTMPTTRIDRVVVGSSGGDKIIIEDARVLPVDSTYVPLQMQVSPSNPRLPAGTLIHLTISNGLPPYRLVQRLEGQSTAPVMFRATAGIGPDGTATWISAARLANIHQPDDQQPQFYIAKDKSGRSATIQVSVFPPVEIRPAQGVAYVGQSMYVSAWGGVHPTAGPWTYEFASNLSGGTIEPDPSSPFQAIYTPGSTAGVTDAIAVKDSEGNQAEARFEVKSPLTIVEANGALTFQGTVTLTVGQTFRFSAVGGTGEGYRWGNYNNYSVYNEVEYGNGVMDSATGEYTARKAGEDQVYVNDSANNAYTIKVEIQ